MRCVADVLIVCGLLLLGVGVVVVRTGAQVARLGRPR